MQLFADDCEEETVGGLPSKWEVVNPVPPKGVFVYDDDNRADWDTTGDHVLPSQVMGSLSADWNGWGVRIDPPEAQYGQFIVNFDAVDPDLGHANSEVIGLEWGYQDDDNNSRIRILSHYYGTVLLRQLTDGDYIINKVANYAVDDYDVCDWYHAKAIVTDTLLGLYLDGIMIFEVRGDQMICRRYEEYVTETLPNPLIYSFGRVGIGVMWGGYVDNVELTSLTELPYICGDTDGNGSINVSDIVLTINAVFGDGSPPNPLDSGDVDCNGTFNVSDIVFLINFVFGDGDEPCDPDGDGEPDC
jgi:hypothetical protein